MKRYIFKYKWLAIISILVIGCASFTEILKAFVLQHIIDSISLINRDLIIELIIIVTVFIIVTISIIILESFCCNKYIKKCMITIKKDLYEHIINKNIIDFRNISTSDYISTLTNDMNIVETDFFQNLVSVFEYIICFVISFIAIFKVNYYFIIFIAITAWLPLIINRLFSSAITKRKLDLSESTSSFISKIKDIFSGFETIKTFNIQKYIENEFMKSNEDLEEKRFKSKYINDSCERLSFGGSLVIWLGSMLLGCYLVMQGKLTVGYVLGVTQLLNNISNPLYRLSFLINKIKAANKLFEKRIRQSLEGNEEIQAIHMSGIPKKIVFQDVSLIVNDTKILQNINMEIEIGKKYVIIGESGSGKSSILKLLMKYYNNYSGNILVNNNELNKIISGDWYKFISMVQQSSYIFNDTIKNNITLFQNYEDEEIHSAIYKSKAKSFIDSLPENINTIIDEDGKNFSGGECQRISIARTLIRNSPILLLDEATSALDEETAFEIEKALLDMEGITVLAVTHNTNTQLLKKYDGIFIVKNGSIVKKGTYSDILPAM